MATKITDSYDRWSGQCAGAGTRLACAGEGTVIMERWQRKWNCKDGKRRFPEEMSNEQLLDAIQSVKSSVEDARDYEESISGVQETDFVTEPEIYYFLVNEAEDRGLISRKENCK